MRRQLLNLCVLLALGASFTSSLQAQVRKKMVIHSKSSMEGRPGETKGYFVDQLKEITFEERAFDLGFDVKLKHHKRDTATLEVVKGADVAQWRMDIIESWKLGNGSDEALINYLKTKDNISDRFEDLKGARLHGLTRNTKYTLLLWGKDRDNTDGPLVRQTFDVPNFPLESNPKVEIKEKSKTYSSFEITFVPNSDVASYYFLYGERPSSDTMHEAPNPFGAKFPSLREYVMQFGTNFKTRKAYEGEFTFRAPGLRPNTTYGIYVVAMDKTGQPSDVMITDVVTKRKGTSQPSKPTIELKNVTHDVISVVVKADANTSAFRTLLVEKDDYDKDPNRIQKLLKESPDENNFPWQSDIDEAEWHDLTPNFDYYVMAMGKNADDVWGAPVLLHVKTKELPNTTPKAAMRAVKPGVPKRRMASQPESRGVQLLEAPVSAPVVTID